MARRQYISPTPGEFPLIASTPWNARATDIPTIEDFIKVKETGFNAGLLYAELSQMAEIRYAAKATNLKLIISNSALLKARDEKQEVDEMKKFVQEATGSEYTYQDGKNKLNGAADSDIITAWFFIDNPTKSELKSLKSSYDDLYSWDTARNIIISLIGEANGNFTGSDTYQQYLNSFCNTFEPMVLSYDYYPFYETPTGVPNTDYSQFYENLIIFSRKYKETGIPFWNYVQCAYVKRTSDDSILYPKATEPMLRFQIFNSLAFCGQGVVFWTYGHCPSNANDNFVSALLDDSGNLTEAGEAVRRINKEIRCLTDIFLGAVPMDYYVTKLPHAKDSDASEGNLPLLTYSEECPYYVRTDGGKGALVTTFNNNDKQVPSKLRHYLMVVSQDMEKSQSATVRFNSVLKFGIGIKAYSILPNLDSENGGYIRSEIQTGARLEFSLPRSGYLLFEYETV